MIGKSARLMPVIIILTALACRERNRAVEHLIENGVEVIVNHLQTDRTAKTKIFEPIQEFVIDLSSSELVQRGLADPAGFDVDSDGNIYVWSQSSNQNYIFKFNTTGACVLAFGRTGQGPGEFQFLTNVRFDSNDELMVLDSGQRKLIYFDKNGNFIRHRIFLKRLALVFPLKNGSYMTLAQISNPGEVFNRIIFNICNSDFEILKEIGQVKYYRPNAEQEFPALNPTGIIEISTDSIFLANSERGYEIECYDKSGGLKRIIRKDFVPVPLSEKHKDALLEKYSRFPPEISTRVIYPTDLPPFQSGFADEDGQLFVMTYEESDTPGHYWHDVFDKEGVFIGRVRIGNYGTYGKSQGFLFTQVRNGRLYHFRENRDGFKELVVSRMK